MMPLNRLKKILSDSGLLSRRKDDLLIKQGKVKLNGNKSINGLQEGKWRDLKTKEWISFIN